MLERIDTNELTLGMFVSELDRPWIDTPFPLQGFIIESQEHIQQLQQHCKYVYIDRRQSVGTAYQEPEEIAIEKPHRAALSSPLPRQAYEGVGERPSTGFLATIKAIWNTAFGTGGSAPKTDRPRSRDQGMAAAEAPGTGSYLEFVRTHTGGRYEITEAEAAHLAAVPTNLGAYFEGGPAFRQPNVVTWLRKLFRSGAGTQPVPPAHEAAAPEVHDQPPVYPDRATFEEELPKATEVQKQSEEVISTIIQDIRNNKPLAIEKAEDAVAWMVESIVRNPDSLTWLVRLKSHNYHTYDHGVNVSVYLLSFGRHLGLPKVYLQLLGTAGLMQDLGKVKVPPELLDKRAPLTEAECEILKAHVTHSVEILRNSRNVSPMLLEIVAQHHERYDGSGYPRSLKGDEISMFGAMAGIVDTFAAMTSGRPHGDPISPQEALQQLYAWRGNAFSAEIVQEFVKCVGVFPVGSLVELNTGEVAVIVAHNRTRRLLPRIMLILDPMKEPYAKPLMLDLANAPSTPAGEAYRIVRGLRGDAYGVDLSTLAFVHEA